MLFQLFDFFISFIFNSEKNRRSRFCRIIVLYKGRNFSGGQGKFKGSLVGAVLLRPFDSDPQLFKAKCIKNCNPVFKTLNSEIECFFLRLKIPKTSQKPITGAIWAPAYTMQSGTYRVSQTWKFVNRIKSSCLRSISL